MPRKSKQKGHPVSDRDFLLFSPQEKIPQDVFDVRSEYNTLFPTYSHPSNSPIHFSAFFQRCGGNPSPQTVSSNLLSVQLAGSSSPQLVPTNCEKFQFGLNPCLASMPVPQNLPYPLSMNRHRKPGIVSPIPASNLPLCSIRTRTLLNHEVKRSVRPCGHRLENSPKYRQMFPEIELRTTRL